MVSRRTGLFAGLAFALTAAAGCGPSTVTDVTAPPHPTSGRIKFADGTPLKGGIVSFRPTQVEAGGGLIRYDCEGLVNDKGEFKVGLGGRDTGCPVGEYKVVVAPRDYGELPGSNSAKIPPAWRNKDTTPQTVTIEAKDNTVDIVLK